MKKLTASLVSAAIMLSSTAVFADTPVVRKMTSFAHILEVANKNRAASANPSEFVIYHQDAPHKPCPPTKGKEKHKHSKKKHSGKHAEKAAPKAKKAEKKAKAAPAEKSAAE